LASKQTAAQKRLSKQKAATLRALRRARAKAKAKAKTSNGKQPRLLPVDLASVHDRLAARVGLLDKREVLKIVGCTFPALWEWMRDWKFPHARIVCGKSKWRARCDRRLARRTAGALAQKSRPAVA